MTKTRQRVITGGTVLVLVVCALAAFFASGALSGLQQPLGAETACNLTSYDVSATGTGTDGTISIAEQHSGEDTKTEVVLTNHDGTLFGKYQTIVKDGVRYYREAGPGDEDYGEWEIINDSVSPKPALPCIEPSSGGATGQSDDPDVTTDTFISHEEGTVRSEFWADSEGRPARARKTFYPPDYVEGATGTAGTTSTVTGTLDYTYSGFGEKNTITAPLVNPDDCIQPFPNMKVSNPTLQMKREPFTHAMQSWDPRCRSSHAPTHNAQFYTFVNHNASRVNDEIVLATMRVNIRMTTRHDDVSLLLLGAQLLDGLEPDAPIVATAEPVEAEAGALRTLEIEKVVPYGAYTIEVRAKDPRNAVFDVTAAHVHEPPAFAQDTYTFSVAEDAAQFASVGTVSATDPEGGAVAYRITSGAAGKFDIDANEGIIVVRAGLDYETTPTYTLTVEARNPNDRTGTATVTINVTDVAGQ